MKKIISLFIFVFISVVCFSQNKIFCEIVGTSNLINTKVSVEIDYGQKNTFWKNDNRLVDENGNVVKFNSMIDALNYLGKQGWSFEQAYVVSHGEVNVYHYLLSQLVDDETQTNFMTKKDYAEKLNNTLSLYFGPNISKLSNKQLKQVHDVLETYTDSNIYLCALKNNGDRMFNALQDKRINELKQTIASYLSTNTVVNVIYSNEMLVNVNDVEYNLENENSVLLLLM